MQNVLIDSGASVLLAFGNLSLIKLFKFNYVQVLEGTAKWDILIALVFLFLDIGACVCAARLCVRDV